MHDTILTLDDAIFGEAATKRACKRYARMKHTAPDIMTVALPYGIEADIVLALFKGYRALRLAQFAYRLARQHRVHAVFEQEPADIQRENARADFWLAWHDKLGGYATIQLSKVKAYLTNWIESTIGREYVTPEAMLVERILKAMIEHTLHDMQ